MRTFTMLDDGAEQLNQLVARSNRLGADETMVVHGGGNTSCKVRVEDALGSVRSALLVKASGSDLRTAAHQHFLGLDLEQLRALRSRDSMPDEEMEFLVGRAKLEPAVLKPSIETLLHAFLPAEHVDHVHADAICALANHSRGGQAVEEVFAGEVAFVEFVRPGFELSARVARLAERSRAVVLGHHGLVTWADTSDDVEAITNELVEQAKAHVAKRRSATSAPRAHPAPDAEDLRRHRLQLRGALSREQRVVLHLDERLRPIADHPQVDEIVEAGAATADHILAVRPRSLILGVGEPIAESLEQFAASYRDYVERHRELLPDGVEPRSAAPAVVLVPGAGALTVGEGKARAVQIADIALHTHTVAADAIGAFGDASALSSEDTFSVEYWPLEMYKLTLRPPRRDFDGHVFIVTGAASGIGRACAEALARDGAAVVAVDRDEPVLADATAAFQRVGGMAVPVAGDVTDARTLDRCIDAAVDEFGGLDGVVLNAGIATVGELETLPTDEWRRCLEVNLTSAFELTQRALRVLRIQGVGGSLVYVSSKNAFSPGAGFGAYAASKAGLVQLARVAAIEGGPLGVRANAVNPDAVFGGSRLWSDEVREERARAHGVPIDQLEQFYADRNLLGAEVRAHDVAEAVAFLLSERSSRTTGSVVTVDGGVAAAFPR
ncbi:MAG TPA: SDR family oxidoreductase [Egibacteraceae bacterium]|nr:SDR family oxidoreductase [Egibacteraceae bacterium]